MQILLLLAPARSYSHTTYHQLTGESFQCSETPELSEKAKARLLSAIPS